MKKKIVGHLDAVNPIMHVCNHLFANKHTHYHRMGAGFLLMPVGVLLSKCFHEIFLLHLLMDMIGYAIHGIGAVPVVDYLICKVKKTEQQEVEVDGN